MMRKRLCIFAIYEEHGQIDDTHIFNLNALKEITQDIVIIVNGTLNNESESILKKYTNMVYYRKNEGLDAGAYRYILRKYFTLNELEVYDELIITNDTCMGPFVSYLDIFEKMEGAYDFWGINYIDNGWYYYLQSNFLVFKDNTFKIVYEYFLNEISEGIQTKQQVCMKFERGLFRELIKNGYIFAYYTKKNTVDCYSTPYQLIVNYGYPFIKKRAFKIGYENNINNFNAVIRYLNENKLYPNDFIYSWCKKNNINITESDESYEGDPVLYSYSHTKEEDILRFLNNNFEIYIYGAGIIAKELYSFYKRDINMFNGFLVSSEKDMGELFGYPVLSINKLTDKSAAIIVGLNEKNSQDIKNNIYENKNILYLWGK